MEADAIFRKSNGMKAPRKIVLFVFLILFLQIHSVYAADAWAKLGRGVNNVLFGFFEIPHQTINMGKHERWPIAMVGGPIKGVFYFIARELVGVYETVTFPVPVPADYEPVMYPEFIFPPFD